MQMYDLPDSFGHFGPYGGVFVAETLIDALDELREAYAKYQHDPEFEKEFAYELKHYVGRPSPVYHAKRWSDHFGGAQVYLKREDLNHTGAHKINNVIGQAMLAKRMGKPRVIAETGAGQHGVATATIAARYGMECVVYMGSEDIRRQAANVYRMKLLGAKVVPVDHRDVGRATSVQLEVRLAELVCPVTVELLERQILRDSDGDKARMQAVCQDVAVDLRVWLDPLLMRTADLATLQPGDVLCLDHEAGHPLTCTVDGRKVFHARFGRHKHRVAVQVVDVIEGEK